MDPGSFLTALSSGLIISPREFPAFACLEELSEAATEDEPSRVAVVAYVAANRGDGQHRVVSRWLVWQWALPLHGHRAKQTELVGIEHRARRLRRRFSSELTERE